jgi:hypothetical protein
MSNTDIQAFVDEVTNTLEQFERDGAKWEHIEILARGIHDIHRYLQEVPTPDGRVVALYAALQYSWQENKNLRIQLQQADKNISTLIQSNAQLTDLVYKMDERLQRVEKNMVDGSIAPEKISSTHWPIEPDRSLPTQTDRQNRQTDNRRQTADRHNAVVIIKQVEMEHPGTSLRQHVEILKANGIEMGKDTVNKIIHDLRKGGHLTGDDLLPEWNNERY